MNGLNFSRLPVLGGRARAAYHRNPQTEPSSRGWRSAERDTCTYNALAKYRLMHCRVSKLLLGVLCPAVAAQHLILGLVVRLTPLAERLAVALTQLRAERLIA